MSGLNQIKFSVVGMSCASCVGRVYTALAAVPGVKEVNVNLAAETAQVRHQAPATPSGLAEILRETGYPPMTQKVVLTIELMSCASCVSRV